MSTSGFRRVLLAAPIVGGLYLAYSLQGGHHTELLGKLSKTATSAQTSVLSFASPIWAQQVLVESILKNTATSSARKPFVRKLVAVGDLHGDMGNARKVLEMSHVVDENGSWSGEVDWFVQTGDIVDRGDDTIRLFEWMDDLRDQASNAGGLVLSNLGNHEWMNAIGDWRYVYPSEIATFGSSEERSEAFSSRGAIGKSWAANYTTAQRIPLSPFEEPNADYPSALASEAQSGPLSHAALSFVHGGLSPTYGSLSPYPSKINTIASSLLRKLQIRKPQPAPSPPNPYPGLPADATAEEHALYDGNGPLWYRGWALDDEETVCSKVDAVLKTIGSRRMIMGHTPDFRQIISRCGGKIIIIDTGISHAYGGALSALSIEYTLTPIEGEGAESRWTEREIVNAVYPDREELIADDEREVVGDFKFS